MAGMNEDKKTFPSARTMADIARLADVSKITVSRALRDSPLVRDETKQRIQTIAREHRYRFNKTARNLRLQRSHTIALAFDSHVHEPLAEPFPLALLSGIADALTSKGFDLLLCAETGASEDWGNAIASKSVDGAIVLGREDTGRMLEGVRRAGLPAVVWGADRRGGPYPTVGSNNVRGGKLAASRLYEVGRRKLLYLGRTTWAEQGQRWEGFEKTARRLGVRSLKQVPVSISQNSGFDAMNNLLRKEGFTFDGVFAQNDMVAMGAIRALERAGLTVPQDVSVVGYDDIPMAADFSPPLTTIAQDSRLAGKLLASGILNLIEGKTVRSTLLHTKLIVRESCASN